MGRIRYVVADAQTRELLADVPFTGFTFSKVLGRPGGWSANIAHDHPAISGDNRSRIDVNRRTVWVLDGTAPPLFGGVIRVPSVRLDADLGADTLQIGGDGIWGLIRGDGSKTGRFWRGARAIITDDAIGAIETILAQTQDLAGGDAGIEVSSTTSGTVPTIAPLIMDRNESPHLGATIERLANDYGIEFDIDYRWDTTSEPWRPVPVLALAYPRRGRTTNVVLEHGRNVDLIDASTDGASQSNAVIGIGAGDGTSQRRALRSNPSMITAGYPLLERVEADKNITSSPRLATFTERQLTLYEKPTKTFTVQVRHDAAQLDLTSLITGDIVAINIDEGCVFEDATPARVDAIDVAFDTENEATISYQLTAAEHLGY